MLWSIQYKVTRKVEKDMQPKKGWLDRLYQNLSSMRLTISLFLTLAACSILGTLLPQGTTLEELHKQHGPGLAWWIDILSLNDLYRAGWFRMILLLLCVNLIICTLQRLPKTLKLIKHRDEMISPERLEKFSCHTEITSSQPLDATQAELARIVAEEFASLQPLANPKAFSAVAERGRWSRMMVYVIHLSVLVILVGALIGSIFGFKGFMNLAEGETSDEVMLAKGRQVITLPFQIRCDNFAVSFYDNGAPKEYRSDLTIIDKGREILSQSILVNDPLTYEGVTFYQASYGTFLKQVELELENRETGVTQRLSLPYREVVPIPGSQDEIEVMQYQENFSSFGQAAAIVLLKEGQQPAGSWILMDMPEFHGNRIQNYRVRVLHVEKSNYTGLQVKQDPAVWFVYFGFTVMVLGIAMTFYTSHRKLWVWASTGKKGENSTKVFIAGRTNKNSLAFEQEFNRLCARLRIDLNPKQV